MFGWSTLIPICQTWILLQGIKQVFCQQPGGLSSELQVWLYCGRCSQYCWRAYWVPKSTDNKAN